MTNIEHPVRLDLEGLFSPQCPARCAYFTAATRTRCWCAEPARIWAGDSGDTLQALQLRVARALVARLAVRQNRVGLASFTLRARTHGSSLVQYTEKSAVIVPVGEPGAVLDAPEDFPAAHQRRRTDLRRRLERAAQLLADSTPAS